MYDDKKLGQHLIAKGIITTSQLEEALKKQKELNMPLGDTLIYLKFVSEIYILETLARALGIDFMNISENNYQILDPALAKILPLETCRKYMIIPVFHFVDEDMKELTLAMADPTNRETILEVENITECRVTPVLSSMSAVEGAIGKLYSVTTVKAEKLQIQAGDATGLINNILKNAIEIGASDIHIEPHASQVYVRMRVDGVMEVSGAYPLKHHASVASRIKVIASESRGSLMRIDEKRLPQDGSFARKISGHEVDFRVSTLPTIAGEKVVMRVLDKDNATFVGRIKDLRMSPAMELRYRKCVRQPNGINIVTGPTGSGKSTTLHAVMNEINTPGINIITVEDPVEHQAGGYINQSSLMPEAGYTYSRALRAIMRQDPDVILIGEVRDLETAEIAIQAALTGHRVFTTLHSDDAASSIARLIEIGVEHFLVSATFVSSLNQRLLRKICMKCAEEYVPTKIEMQDVGLEPQSIDEIMKDLNSFNLRRGRGCEHCRNTGYSGRQGVFELIAATPMIRDLILQKQPGHALAKLARETDHINMLFEEGIRLFLSGVTSLGELQNLPRGEYELKSIHKIIKSASVQ
ncbi:MAG: GspE/PulE family protein [Proteobacteria bacterium]|nr:GspE/PulE family protein [Pseudomonadota bacterium]MBU1687308.1 GspE/PulE family protein [Pseudomonadota bacterium]